MRNPASWKLSGKLSRTGRHWEFTGAAPEPNLLRPDRAPLIDPGARQTLARDLRREIRGEVRFDQGSRALYSTDASNYRQVPIGVVLPRDAEDVLSTLRVARAHGAPVFPRGGGTSLAGQCCNVAVVMDFTKYMRGVLELSPEEKRARVLPGTVLDDLRNQAKRHGLTFGPDPSTHNHCTLGGMIGNNSCGVHSMMAGRTSDNVHELEIVTADGERMRVGPTSEFELARIIREGGRRGEIYSRLKSLRDRNAELIRTHFPRIPRSIYGYNLNELLPENGFNVARALVGTEGTCVTILEATVRLVDWPKHRSLVILGYPDIYSCGDHVARVREHHPIGLEGFDDKLIRYTVEKGIRSDARKWLPEGNGWLLVEFGGDTPLEADAKVLELIAHLKLLPGAPSVKTFDDPEKEEQLWKIREAGLGATARVPNHPDSWPGWEDSAVAPEKVGDYLRDLHELFEKYDYDVSLYGHLGQGCVHVRTPFDLLTAHGIRKFRSFMEEATDLIVRYGGSISGEHGYGQARAEFLEKRYGPELIAAFREFKSIWDPEWRMNPGKVIDPYPIEANLRLGTRYDPPQPKTEFAYPEDKGSLPYAGLRCVGIGECRRVEGGTMCPSYKVTLEEKHSTRGRSRLFQEMLTKDFLKEGWRSEAVKSALDLCLACKACKKECPMNVDMATYKAEFLSHYYRTRWRPLTAFAMGWIDQWARLAAAAPRLVNFLAEMPILSTLVKKAAGIAPQRKIPAFAPVTFKEWFAVRPPRNEGMPEVILWADTFNNHFEPAVAAAAVEVLESAGFHIQVSQQHLCCGRPLYDYGMLDQAKAYLHRIVSALRGEIRAGTPIVALEPSCAAVFRDELRNLFPNDQDGARLSKQVYTLAEFLDEKAPGFKIPRFERDAIVQVHCHHRSVLKSSADQRLMKKMGLNARELDSGCCGMAGSFGYESEAGKYDVSIRAGERVLLPAVREASEETLILSDGFSCRSQISQCTPRKPLHLAQVLAMALGKEPPAELRGPKKPVPFLRILLGIAARVWKMRPRFRNGTAIADRRGNEARNL